MTLTDLSYHRPATLAEARELARELGDDARLLAGGTELLVDLRSGRDRASHLISLRDVAELRAIRADADGLHIGAMATLAAVLESEAVREGLPALAEAIAQMGGAQIRNQATIGGNFCRAVPCADTPPVCIAAGASVSLICKDGERTLPAEELTVGPRLTVLEPGELLVAIHVPPLPATAGSSYQRFSLRGGMALAVAAVAAVVELDGEIIKAARVVLNAVAPIPLIAREASALLVGEEPSEALFARAGAKAAEEAQPITDLRATETYRRQLTEVLTPRALSQATERARRRSA
jgi:carbon-monoxide dehydrogenase medium subunit